jgi:hypothetical protein
MRQGAALVLRWVWFVKIRTCPLFPAMRKSEKMEKRDDYRHNYYVHRIQGEGKHPLYDP